ncbi:hypothetical protein CKM354_001034600 [Cercospora kikuchii]|uniref:Uncharacterized protein n=1 Tax=Cercospora kikuchii TaxID=84275 RepID=A0A9P3FKJ9_9PEZI|nr:uncharacterized protein CKM354_001034600 [Cercospora kikuchii]GIZ47249.1 hypothetical protein CKM354_001034600 [Cercospora kikuchii]
MLSKSFSIAILASTLASGSVIPAKPEAELLPRVDQPSNPWINENCFHPYEVPLGVKSDKCPKKNTIKDDGNGKYCSGNSPWSNSCQRYCEETLEWRYGEVYPFDNTRCGKGSACRLDQNMRVDVGQSTTFNIGITQAAFSAGASFTWTETKSTGNGIIRDKPAALVDSCGFWAFVPHIVKSCGISAKSDVHSNPFNKWCANRVDENVCIESVFQTATGTASGDTVFVATDCTTGAPLPDDKQDPIYLKAQK